MTAAFVEIVESLIYGNGLAPNPNHRDWVAANPSPSGLQWFEQHVDRMLAAYEAWLAADGLPPATPWDGVRREPWDASRDLPLGQDLNGSFTGVATLEALGGALRSRYGQVASAALELRGLLKAPFSYRYWSYMKWAREMRQRFQGLTVFPTGRIYDRDGTLLSAAPFCDTFNDLHRNWHVGSVSSGVITPGLRTTAGQRSRLGSIGMSREEEFLRFHREHLEVFHRWLERTGQPALRPIDMGRPGGWPPTGPPPQVDPPPPWSYSEVEAAASGLFGLATLQQIGSIESGYHGAGHGQNSDIAPLPHNNYVPRFHNWHSWIDSQWWWREPRFASSDPATGERTRMFRPVLQDDSAFPGPLAISIVRDPAQAADVIHPANALGGLDLATGDGTLRMKMYVHDPQDRTLRLRLTAEVLDRTGAAHPVLTVHRSIGPGGDHPLDAEFTEDLALAGAFLSDDSARADLAVGFVNGRIRVTGRLWAPDNAAPDNPAQSPDPGFVHEDFVEIDLVNEKLGPEVLVYQDMSSFSEEQVASTLSAGTASFDDAFQVVVQDRTTPAVVIPAWPPLVADEVKGLLLGPQAASGLFDDVGHEPAVVLWRDDADQPFAGVAVRLQGPPTKEDAALPPEVPQRLNWRYAIDFDAANDAFAGLNLGEQRLARLRVTVRDRAGNETTVEQPVKLFKDANPYTLDGPIPWLSVDTRVFSLRQDQTRLGETVVAGQPLQYLSAILDRLNTGNTGPETFDTLAEDGAGAALDFASEIRDTAVGTTEKVNNFALARVRLPGAAGAQGVRAFFRVFRYTEPNLIFSPAQGYRAHSAGATAISLLGFETTLDGAPLASMPFFAASRVDATSASMTTQTDPINVHDFPAGPGQERVWYFGALLDINHPTVRLPATLDAGSPDGPFPSTSLQSIRTLMRDLHHCLVVEINYDGDPTVPMVSPTASDNLALRNLSILSSDNPGDGWTRTVEQAFDIDLSRPPAGEAAHHEHEAEPAHGDHDEHGAHDEHEGHEPDEEFCPCCGHTGLDVDGLCIRCAGAEGPLASGTPMIFQSTFQFEALAREEAMSLAMQLPHEDGAHDHQEIADRLLPRAAAIVHARFPLVFHPTRWTQTAALVDELMIRWNDLPAASEARLFLPGIATEDIVNLRNLRHAPATVRAEGDAILRLDVGGVTYIPVPPVKGDRLSGSLAITLPEGVRASQEFIVDVTQFRAGDIVPNGGFRVQILVRKAEEFFEQAADGVAWLQEQLSLTPRSDRWHPVLERRLCTERLRVRGLAESAGVAWDDPTVWLDDDGEEHPIRGMKLRVVLERVVVLDDRDPWLKGAGEIDFEIVAQTNNNAGLEQRTRLPESGQYRIASGESLDLDETIFEGFVEDHLGIRINAMERDLLDPDDNIGAYTRTFSCGADTWLGSYRPGDEAADPEDVGYWQVFYRIERA